MIRQVHMLFTQQASQDGSSTWRCTRIQSHLPNCVCSGVVRPLKCVTYIHTQLTPSPPPPTPPPPLTTIPGVLRPLQCAAAVWPPTGVSAAYPRTHPQTPHPCVLTPPPPKQVFYGRSSVPLLSGPQLASLLQQHLTANIMRVGGRYLLQSSGIPQGSLASTLMCR